MGNNVSINELTELFKAVNEDPDFDYSSITESTSIFDELGLNSIGILYISLSIEEKYGVSISNEDIKNIKTVGDLLGFINAK